MLRIAPALLSRKSALGVAGPGADPAFLAAVFVAFAGCRVERTRNMGFHRVTVGAARVGHVDRQRGTGTLHGHRSAFALALLQRRGARVRLAGIIIGLAVGA